MDKNILKEYCRSESNINELKKLLQINNKLNRRITVLRRSVNRKKIYLKSLQKFKNITIEPDAKLIIYWND